MEYSEETVPLTSRVFLLEGRVSSQWIEEYKELTLPNAIQKYSSRLDDEWKNSIYQYKQIPKSDTQVYLIASFSYADLFVGKTFDVIYRYNDASTGIKSKAVILAFIHEWCGIPVPYVGCGHRSICLIDFPDGIPNLITELPEIDKYKASNLGKKAALCSEETWNLFSQ